jgi:hypothetical protein
MSVMLFNSEITKPTADGAFIKEFMEKYEKLKT